MTKTTIERLAVLEEKQDRANQDILEIKTNQVTNHEHLSKKMDDIHSAVTSILNDHEERLKSAEETIEPFTKFRRNLWYMIVFSLLGIIFYVMVQTKHLPVIK